MTCETNYKQYGHLNDIPVDYFENNRFMKNIKSNLNQLLPDGTVIFVGINLVLDNGEWKQKNCFAKVQSFGKAEPSPRESVVDNSEKIENNQKLISELNNLTVTSLNDW